MRSLMIHLVIDLSTLLFTLLPKRPMVVGHRRIIKIEILAYLGYEFYSFVSSGLIDSWTSSLRDSRFHGISSIAI